MRTLVDRRLDDRTLNPSAVLPAPVLWISSRFPYDLDGSDRVETAYDQSGNSYDATQATAAARPYIIQPSGQRYPWFDFSQGNHFLTTTGPGAPPASQRTIMAATWLTGGSGRRTMVESYPQYYGGSIEVGSGGVLEVFSASATSALSTFERTVATETTFPIGSPQVVGMVRTGEPHSIRVYRNRTHMWNSSGGSTNPNTGSQTGFRIGTYRDADGRWWQGYIGEVIVWNVEFDDDLMDVAMRTLRSIWLV